MLDDIAQLVQDLVPDEILSKYELPPPAHLLRDGQLLPYPYRVFRKTGGSDVRVEVWPLLHNPDPCYVLELKRRHLGEIEIVWIAANDLTQPHYHVDPQGNLPLSPKSGRRDVGEEMRAMAAGLAPYQVRAGLGIFRQALEKIENFALRLEAPSLSIFPMAYHNAIFYERNGFSYRAGHDLMERIQKGFAPGGEYQRQLDGKTVFRRPWMATSIRGRSWAIHDGILREACYVPSMYKRLNKKPDETNETAPGVRW